MQKPPGRICVVVGPQLPKTRFLHDVALDQLLGLTGQSSQSGHFRCRLRPAPKRPDRCRPDPALPRDSRGFQNRPFRPVCLHVVAGHIRQRPKKSIEANFGKAKPVLGVTMGRRWLPRAFSLSRLRCRRCGGLESAERVEHDIVGRGCATSQPARRRSTCKAKPDAPGSPNSGRSSRLGTW